MTLIQAVKYRFVVTTTNWVRIVQLDLDINTVFWEAVDTGAGEFLSAAYHTKAGALTALAGGGFFIRRGGAEVPYPKTPAIKSVMGAAHELAEQAIEEHELLLEVRQATGRGDASKMRKQLEKLEDSGLEYETAIWSVAPLALHCTVFRETKFLKHLRVGDQIPTSAMDQAPVATAKAPKASNRSSPDKKSVATPKSTKGHPVAGKTVVLTGTFAQKRGDLEAKLRALGANVSGSISAKTDLLFVGADAGSKLQKAKQMGMGDRIQTEQQLLKILK